MATIKQKLVFQKVLKGAPISKAMKEVGYAATTSKTTGKLTRSDGWQELLNKHVSDERLTQVLVQGLEATRMVTIEGETEEVNDYAVRHKYLETGLKLKGRLKEKSDGDRTNIINFFESDQIRRIASRVLDGDTTGEEGIDRLPDSDEL